MDPHLPQNVSFWYFLQSLRQMWNIYVPFHLFIRVLEVQELQQGHGDTEILMEITMSLEQGFLWTGSMIISGVIRVLFWPNYTDFCSYTQQVTPKLQAVYSLEGKHFWYRVLKYVMLLEIHVCVTFHCLCLLVLPMLFSFNWDMVNKFFRFYYPWN